MTEKLVPLLLHILLFIFLSILASIIIHHADKASYRGKQKHRGNCPSHSHQDCRVSSDEGITVSGQRE